MPRCTACNVDFDTPEAMAEHYQSDFHANNVRLRVAGKNTMSEAEFRRSNVAEDDARPVFACNLCKKSFRSVQTLQSHVKSTAHLMKKEERILNRDATAGSMLTSTSLGSAALGLHRRFKAHNQSKVAAAPAPSPDAPVAPKPTADDRDADVSELRCLFCGFKSKTMRANLQHMLDIHEFTIPLVHRVKDVQALMQYLARKVNGCLCLVCGEDTKSYGTLDALRSHMRNADHEYMVLTSEYAEFYNGTLDDGTPVELSMATDAREALIVPGTQRRVQKKDESGLVKATHTFETPQQMEQRRMIADTGCKQQVAILRERAQLTRKETTAAHKVQRRQDQRMQRRHMEVSIRMSKLHPKGYDGEGEVN